MISNNKTRKIINDTYLVLFGVFFVLLLTLKILEDRHVIGFHTLPVQILVPGCVGITMIYSLLNFDKKNMKQILIIVALLFAMIAEIINACDLSFGLLFFAVTHVCLVTYHFNNSKWRKGDIWSLLVFIGLYVGVVVTLEVNLHTTNLEYILVIPLYMLILSLMAWRSVCTWGNEGCGRIILGSLLFYLCDVFILAELCFPNFTNPPLILLILSWVCYIPSLFFLSMIDQKILMLKKFPKF